MKQLASTGRIVHYNPKEEEQSGGPGPLPLIVVRATTDNKVSGRVLAIEGEWSVVDIEQGTEPGTWCWPALVKVEETKEE